MQNIKTGAKEVKNWNLTMPYTLVNWPLRSYIVFPRLLHFEREN